MNTEGCPISIIIGERGFPLLPDINIDSLTPKTTRKLLTEYITAAWSELTFI